MVAEMGHGEWGHNTKTPIPENLTSPPIPL